jgi:DNA-binding PadR family transcriptional regulator
VTRVLKISGGRIRLSTSRLYPILGALAAEGLLAGWQVVPGRTRGGRSRRYYELTPRGIEAAESECAAFSGLLTRPRIAIAAGTPAEMRRRLQQTSDLSASVLELRDRMRESAR